jgi:hypothetical protein
VVALCPPRKVTIEIGEQCAILRAENQVLTFATDNMFDIFLLASAHQLHGAPATLQKPRLKVSAFH